MNICTKIYSYIPEFNGTNLRHFALGSIGISSYLMTNLPLAILSMGACHYLAEKVFPRQVSFAQLTDSPAQNMSLPSDPKMQKTHEALDFIATLLEKNGPLSEEEVEKLHLAQGQCEGSEKLDPLIQTLSHRLKMREKDRALAIYYGASVGHLGIVKTLLPSPDLISEEERDYALSEAVGNGHLEVIRFLLKNVSLASRHLRRAIMYAADNKNGHLEVLQFLLENTQVLDKDRGRAICCAATHGNLETIQLLLKNARIPIKYLQTAAGYAVAGGHTKLALFLLPHTSSIYRRLIIRHAAKNGSLEVIQHLLKNADIPDESRKDAILDAVSTRCFAVAKFLHTGHEHIKLNNRILQSMQDYEREEKGPHLLGQFFLMLRNRSILNLNKLEK